MVAEREQANGASPPPLIGGDPTAPGMPAADPEQSVPPPSAPPSWSTPQMQAPTPVAPSAPALAPQPAAQLEPEPVAQPAAAMPQAAVVLPPTPMPPPPGWYGDIYGNPPRWWDGTVWTEHLLVQLPSAEPAADDDVELNFFDNAWISFQLAPDWAKFLMVAVVTAVLALIALGLLSGGSGDSDTPDGFVPPVPELGDPTVPETQPEIPGAPGGIEETAPG
jgi:hypothetical protein